VTDLPESTTLASFGGEAAERLRESSPRESALEEEVLALFERHRGPLLGYLLRFNTLPIQDCEEVVQETFVALFRHLQRGRSRENLSGWLFRVVRNLGLKRLQVSRRESENVVRLSGAIEKTVFDPGLSPEEAVSQDEDRRRLLAVVKALPEQDQRCLALRAEGIRYRQIAEVLGISLGGVANSLERSLERITRAAQR
jgi:RNA polymerase sigma-70 factor, ECF subfamily